MPKTICLVSTVRRLFFLHTQVQQKGTIVPQTLIYFRTFLIYIQALSSDYTYPSIDYVDEQSVTLKFSSPKKAESKPTNLEYCTESHKKVLFPQKTTLRAPNTILEVALVMNLHRSGSINHPVQYSATIAGVMTLIKGRIV